MFNLFTVLLLLASTVVGKSPAKAGWTKQDLADYDALVDKFFNGPTTRKPQPVTLNTRQAGDGKTTRVFKLLRRTPLLDRTGRGARLSNSGAADIRSFSARQRQ